MTEKKSNPKSQMVIRVEANIYKRFKKKILDNGQSINWVINNFIKEYLMKENNK